MSGAKKITNAKLLNVAAAFPHLKEFVVEDGWSLKNCDGLVSVLRTMHCLEVSLQTCPALARKGTMTCPHFVA